MFYRVWQHLKIVDGYPDVPGVIKPLHLPHLVVEGAVVAGVVLGAQVDCLAGEKVKGPDAAATLADFR